MKDAVNRIRSTGESKLLGKLVDEEHTEEQPAPLQLKEVTIQNANEWMNLDSSVGVIVVGSNCCNEDELNVIDLGTFTNLREWRVSYCCFKNVEK